MASRRASQNGSRCREFRGEGGGIAGSKVAEPRIIAQRHAVCESGLPILMRHINEKKGFDYRLWSGIDIVFLGRNERNCLGGIRWLP